MAIQPKYHWQFTERESNVTQDSLRGQKGQLLRTSWQGHGRIGQAIQLDGKDSHIKLGNVLGKFGTNDFTVAFGIKILNVDGQNQSDLIGSRNIDGHANWFALFLQNRCRVLAFAVDEDNKGKHFIEAKTKVLSHLPNKKWHHIAIVREGKTVKIYLDGAKVAEATSKTGVANITNSAEVRLGHYTEHTAKAQYEDLRVYYSALTQEEIQSLIPPYNPPLKEGEIELVGDDDASIILTQDVDSLSPYSTNFQALRLGHNTGVTLYKQSGFEGTAQKCYADLPNIRESRLKEFPQSVRLWSTVGEPFTGKWVIQAPNGKYLSLAKSSLTATPLRSLTELFKLHHNLQHSRLQIIPGVDHKSTAIKVSPEVGASPLYVDMSNSLTGEFSIVNRTYEQWLELRPDDTFIWTNEKSDRTIFTYAAKFAENEGQVGELAPGEVALYEHYAYHGKTWILANPTATESNHFTHFSDFQGLNDQTSSIRVGPDTGVTLFRNSGFHVSDGNEEKEIEDIVDNVPNLKDSQVGDDALSSIKIFRTIDPTEVFSSYTSQLSQDYRMIGEKLEEFSAYRTILRLEAEAGDIEVSATDLTTIEVDGENYEIDEQRSVTLTPNAMNRIMITSEADGIDTPGLKFRTQSMAPNERVVIFPNQAVHQQIAELEDDALWNATDTQGNLIVDHKAHSKEEVTSVQNTVKRMMGTVSYVENESAAGTRSATNSQNKTVLSSSRTVSGATIENHPWELHLGSANTSTQVRSLKSGEILVQAKSLTSDITSTGIEEKEISQDEFMQLLSQSTSGIQTALPSNNKGFGTSNLVVGRGILGGIKKAIKKAKSIVVGVVKGAVHLLVKTVEGVVDFVIDTVKKVVEVVEAVIETVVKVIKKFIEFLQFLFNWGDILETQRYLKRTVNDGLDTISEQIDSFKQPVSEFVGSLQDSVEEGMNSVVTLLGGNPSEAETFESNLPEAAEWFISKLLSGLGKPSASPFPTSSSAENSDSEIGIFYSTLMESGEDILGMSLRAFDGLTNTIAALIQNPLKPQFALIAIVETFRDIIIQFLDLLETLILGFLDILKKVIQRFKSLINGKIRIPLISALFKLLGAGDLSILNVTTLLAAIPITLVSKLVLGQKPFQEDSLLEVSSLEVSSLEISTFPALQLATETTEEAPISRQANTSELDKAQVDQIRRLGTAQLVLSTISGVFTAILNASSVSEAKGFGKTVISFFEGLTFIVDLVSWGLSYTSFSIIAKLNNNQKDAEKEGRQNFILLYRLGVLLLDSLFMISSDEKRRMKRQDEAVTFLFFLLSIIDLSLTTSYLYMESSDAKRSSDLEIANEMVSLLPDILAPIRYLMIGGIPGAFALAALDLLSTGVTLGLGIKLNNDTLSDLRQAIA